MPFYRVLLPLLLFLLLAMGSYAAFPVKTAPDTAYAGAVTGKVKMHNVVAAAKSLLHLPDRGGKDKVRSSLASILSFVFAVAGVVMFPLSVSMIGVPAAGILFSLAVLLALAGLVLGAIAILKKHKLQGFAIAGFSISVVTLFIIGVLVAFVLSYA